MQLVNIAAAAILLCALAGHAPTSPAQPASPARWRGTIDLHIGGADADDNATFGRVSGLAVDGSGRIFVGDAAENQIRMFSPVGRFIGRIGRMGSGPLEFKHLATIAIGPDKLLWTRDEGNARMLGIDVAATPARGVKNIALHQFSGGSRAAITFEPDGSLVDETIWFDNAADSFRPLRLRITPTGTIARTDTLVVPAGANAGVHKITAVQKDAGGRQVGISQRYIPQPFGPRWLRVYGPGGVRAEAVTSRYEVRIFDSGGRLLRTLTRTVSPVALSAREKRVSDSTLRQYKERLPFGVPAAKSPIVALMWTNEGQLWVERAVGDGRAREGDVFDQSGRWIAIAEWPADIDLASGFPVIAGTTVTAVATDSSDVERVVRLRFR